jgi:hypothetical protein
LIVTGPNVTAAATTAGVIFLECGARLSRVDGASFAWTGLYVIGGAAYGAGESFREWVPRASLDDGARVVLTGLNTVGGPTVAGGLRNDLATR